MSSHPQGHPLVYRIDARNRITWVNAAWTEFARDNGGDALLPDHVLGRDLLGGFADATVRELYEKLIQHVRAGRAVRFDYRCDAPDQRRTFTMEMTRLEDDGIEFVSTLRRTEPRAPVALLRAGIPRDAARVVRMCSWCQSVATPDGRWLEVETAVAELGLLETARMPLITHGMCPSCYARMVTTLGAG